MMAKKKKAGAPLVVVNPVAAKGKDKTKDTTSNGLKTTKPKTAVGRKKSVPGPVLLTPVKKKSKLAASVSAGRVQPPRACKKASLRPISVPISIATQKQAKIVTTALTQSYSPRIAHIASEQSDAYETFHRNVVELIKKTTEPCPPKSYQELEYSRNEDYVLLYEEEQHLADGIAFLAQTKNGGKFVSAVTLEQSLDPPSLTVRLASNEPPATEVLQDLKAALEVVQSYAQKGVELEKNRMQLFDQIVRLSKERLYSRIDKIMSSNKSSLKVNTSRQSCSQIGMLIKNLSSLFSVSTKEIESLCSQLRSLEQIFQEASSSRFKDENSQIESLKTTIRVCAELVSRSSESLEELLGTLHVPISLCHSRVVIEIDKISRYASICEELMNFARRRRTRPMFQSLYLESCKGYHATRPPGSRLKCHVHAEVQLILFYEQNGKIPPPRAIGSSKSACFLCDLFISKHGKFHVSHSHCRLYEQWTVPRGPWSNSQIEQDLRKIMEEMSMELIKLRNAPRREIFQGHVGDNGAESRLHLLRLPEGFIYTPLDGSRLSSIAECDPAAGETHFSLSKSSSTSVLLLPASGTGFQPEDGESSSQLHKSSQRDLVSHSALQKTITASDAASHSHSVISEPPTLTKEIREPLMSGSNISAISIMSSNQPTATYSLRHLPLKLSISKSEVAFVLNVGNVEYIFDLEEIKTGMICIDKALQRTEQRVDIRELLDCGETSIQDLDNSRKVEFTIHDGMVNELLISVSWD